MKYKYIILSSSWDLHKFVYSDVNKIDNAIVISGENSLLNRIEQFFFKVYASPKLNARINLPFKNRLSKLLFDRFSIADDAIIIVNSHWLQLDYYIKWISYIRHHVKKAKIVWYLDDLYSSFIMYDGKTIDLNYARNNLDLIISFDPMDCNKYGFTYHPLFISEYKKPLVELSFSDVYFLGRAKNRYEEIIKVYEYLRDYGLKCDFHIVGVPKEKQKYATEIHYASHFSYEMNIQHILHTKCLLELMQKGGTGYSQRVAEALRFNKRILTNNPVIHQASFYNPDYICQFSSNGAINQDFIEAIKNGGDVYYENAYQLSPCHFLTFVEELLD